MDELQRKQRIIELEAQYRRTETALAVAQAEHERSFTELWTFTAEGQQIKPALVFSPDLVMH
jgi:hypothetical protein